ncbi:DUF2938 domain-containing protein [Zooshikella sp. RANM57]|uniref:DUF2938 domain-containing protein n=1 Tax=Zooshikella sp. RANM57 TaxID=3425863 RepID=UPI003D6DCF31
MSIEYIHFYGAVIVGLVATLIMDLWTIFLHRTFNITSLNYCLVGRWILHMPSGTFKHYNIAKTPKKTAECIIGWISHYLIGIAFVFTLVIPTQGHWLAYPTLFPALLVGIITVLIPFFIMQPSMGLGIAASKTPYPTRARLKSLITHTVFGFGLYLSALPTSYLLSIYD